jgi:hypothetical protein
MGQLETYANMIHTQMVQDLGSWQDAHDLYLKASHQFESKLSVVVGLENSFQQLLHFVKQSQENIANLVSIELQPLFFEQSTVEPAQEIANIGIVVDMAKETRIS